MTFEVFNAQGELEGVIARPTKEEAVVGTMKLLQLKKWPEGWTVEPKQPARF